MLTKNIILAKKFDEKSNLDKKTILTGPKFIENQHKYPDILLFSNYTLVHHSLCSGLLCHKFPYGTFFHVEQIHTGLAINYHLTCVTLTPTRKKPLIYIRHGKYRLTLTKRMNTMLTTKAYFSRSQLRFIASLWSAMQLQFRSNSSLVQSKYFNSRCEENLACQCVQVLPQYIRSHKFRQKFSLLSKF